MSKEPEITTIEMTSEIVRRLSEEAERCRANAYAPYSRYAVGAALLTANGQIFGGCNVENASYGMTLCAERVAIGSAIAAGERNFAAIAVATRDGGTPCGACRQVLVEFNPEMSVILTDDQGASSQTIARDLLPGFFRLKLGEVES